MANNTMDHRGKSFSIYCCETEQFVDIGYQTEIKTCDLLFYVQNEALLK